MASEMEVLRGILGAAGEIKLEELSWPERRQHMEALGTSMSIADGVVIAETKLGDIGGLKFSPAKTNAGRVLLYLHGGGYCVGSAASHKCLVSHIASEMQTIAYSIDYRVAPEAPFPAAVDDALASYKALLNNGVDPSNILIAGDSAGAGLSLACALAARDADLPQPAGIMLISPWVDMTASGWSYAAKAESDPMISKESIQEFAETYLNGANAKDPLASPCFADLSGLPPMLIQVGSEECLLSDSILLAERAGAAGVKVQLETWPEMTHVWHLFHDYLTSARAAISGIANWGAARWAE